MNVYTNSCLSSPRIRLVLLMIFLVLSDWWPEGGGGVVADTPKRGICEIQAAFHLKTITPSWESNATSIDGCYSKEVTARSQEVHVLHLKEPAPGGPPPPQVVTVHVRPMIEHAVHGGPLVIVLHSDYSVNWRLIGHRLTNDTAHRIIVTRDSQVIEIKDLRVNIHRKDAGGRLKHLLAWISKRQGAITSYARIEGANHVYLKVGITEGDDLPVKCNWKRRGHQVPNVNGVYQEIVPISQRQGCISSGTVGKNDRIVHVIKIHEVHEDLHFGGNTNELARVVVDLVSKDGRPVTRDVGLILQASTPVVWIVQSEGVWGRLDLITEGKVETPRGSKPSSSQRLSVRTEPLPNVTKDLLSYAVDWFGPSFAFTEVYRANRLHVVVDDHDGGVASDKGPRSATEEKEEVQQSLVVAVANKNFVKAHLSHGGLDGETEANTRVLVKSSAPSDADDIIRMPNLMLMNAMTVECLPQHMRVSFPRHVVEQLGLQPPDITLTDSHCSVFANETHYVLSSPFHFCGTKQIMDHDKIVYKNAVHFHFHVHKVSSKSTVSRSTSLDGGPPYDDEDNGDVGSGAGALPVASTSHEPSSEPRSLQFQCEYLSPGGITATRVQEEVPSAVQNVRDTSGLTATRELFKMELYRDPSYIRSVLPTDYPFSTSEHDSLYVETRFIAGPTLRVVTDDCWLSESSDPNVVEPHIQLIRDTCPVGPTVKFEMSNDDTNHRFSFQMAPEYADHPVLYVHCKLAICTTDSSQSSRWNMKICVDPIDFCETESLRAYVERPRGTHHTTFTKGPFQVKRRTVASDASPTAAKIATFQSTAPFRSQGKVGLDVVGGGGGGGGGTLGGLSETIDVRCTLPEQQPVIILGLSTEVVFGIAFASFIIGVGLSAALYCIYLKTDPYRRSPNRSVTHNSGYDLSGHSGSSTPSSQSPMTA